jgi:recombination protein RecT
MEHDSPYGELALTSPDGQIVHHLDWQSQHPVALLKNVQRLTAPNPGVMTGPGTNTYWVGDPHGGYIVIDPGPADPDHLERIWRATGGQIRMIVCTHSHPDHSPSLCSLFAKARPVAYRLFWACRLPAPPTHKANSNPIAS